MSLDDLASSAAPPTPPEFPSDSLVQALHTLTQSLTKLEQTLSNSSPAEKTPSTISSDTIMSLIQRAMNMVSAKSVCEIALSGDYSQDPVTLAMEATKQLTLGTVKLLLEDEYGSQLGFSSPDR